MLRLSEQERKENKNDKFTEDLTDSYAKEMIDRKIMSLRNVYIFVGQALGIDLREDKILEEI